jgi:hypothetical protein
VKIACVGLSNNKGELIIDPVSSPFQAALKSWVEMPSGMVGNGATSTYTHLLRIFWSPTSMWSDAGLVSPARETSGGRTREFFTLAGRLGSIWIVIPDRTGVEVGFNFGI